MRKKKEQTFLDFIFRYIESLQLISPGDKVIIGVSGGADSVCLLEVLEEYRKQCPLSIVVVHVEHGLRGEDSLRDARFVEKICRDRTIPFIMEQVNVREIADNGGMTLEEAGRHARYEIFEKYRISLGADKIAVAHNQNDQAETVLMNLARGSGLRGLGGIAPKRGRTIRPLLGVSRGEIEAWLKERNQPFCIDATNLESDYTRNRVRMEILPQLQESVNEGAVRHIAESAAHIQKAEQYLQKVSRVLYEQCVCRDGADLAVKIPELLAAEELLQEYVLRKVIENELSGRGLKDYSSSHIEDLKRLAEKPCGKMIMLPGGLRVSRRRELLVFSGNEVNQTGAKKNPMSVTRGRSTKRTMAAQNAENLQAEILLEKDGIYELNGVLFQVEYGECPENDNFFPEKKYTKWLSYDTINKNVCLRTRREGDYLVVNRDGGRKKLKDYLIDRKIPREERDRILLVAQGSHILWVVGERISEAAKVTGKTRKVIMIRKMEDEA